MSLRRISSLSALFAAGIVSAALTGCGTSVVSTSAGGSSLLSSVKSYGGTVMGAQSPVTGATVQLWAAGTTGSGPAGYGANAVAVGASTLTDANGNFNLDNSSGVSPCVTGQSLYITSQNGNTGGVATPEAMMVALPLPCNSTTGAQTVIINEETTVAAVWSLQQFMSITPGAAIPWKIGAPASNVIGLQNAFLHSQELVTSSGGAAAISTNSNTIAGVTYTTTITPDINRINTLSDILSTCINGGASICNQLYSDVTPSGATTPSDTIQAAYYLATNPGGLTMANHGFTQGSPYYLCANYVAAASPFQPTLTCTTTTYPSDWAIGVGWRNVSGAAALSTTTVGGIALDAAGNIWTSTNTAPGAGVGVVNQFSASGAISIAPIVTVSVPAYSINEIYGTTNSPPNAVMQYPGNVGYILAQSHSYSLAVDTFNNAWYGSFSGAIPGTATNGTTTFTNTGVLTQITPNGNPIGWIVGNAPSALSIDGNNNIYMQNAPVSGRYFMSTLASSGGQYNQFYQGVGRSTTYFGQTFVDQTVNQTAWLLGGSSCGTRGNISTQNLSNTSNNSTTAQALYVTETGTCPGTAAADAVGNEWGTFGGGLAYYNLSTGLTTPTITTFTGSTNAVATGASGQGGLDKAGFVAIDGVGNIWVTNPVATATGGLSEFIPTTVGTTTTITPLSPGNTTGVFGFQIDGAAGVAGAVIDNSGNIWLESSSGSSMYHMVGLAAPVVTPTAQQIASGTIGVRP
jgi:hypothetical protein